MSHEIPRTKLDTLHEVLAGYNKTVEVGEEVSDEEVSDHRDVSEDTAGRQKKFLAEIDVLDKDGYDYYLTEDGYELGRMIRFNNMDKAADIYGDLLNNWEPTEEILAHVDEDGLSLEDLADNVALVTANELSTPRKERGAKTIVELLEWSGFLVEENGTYYMAEESESTQVGETEEEPEATEPTPKGPEEPQEPRTSVKAPGTGTEGVQSTGQVVHTGGINISLDISGDDDPENVRQLLLAIRQATQEDIDSYEKPNEDE